MGLTLVTGPSDEPLLAVEAKSHLRVDIADDDVLIAGLITAAREMAEMITRRALITQTWNYVMDAFPGCDRLELPLPPLQSVISITYVDSDGNSGMVSSDDYIVDTGSVPGRIVLKSGATWPGTALRAANGVTMQFVCGYEEANDVPQAIKQAMLLYIGHLYENREATVGVGNVQPIPFGIDALLWPYRVMGF